MKYGDLMGMIPHIKNDIETVRFIVAQLVLVLEYLHDQNILYRDLKPENVLIGNNGYIKLADFGFVKKQFFWQRATTFCGTH